MAKLPRVTAKVFASNAAAEDIGQYGSALTGTKVTTGDIAEIQALPAYETGWRGAVVSNRNYPTLQEMNGLQKTFSQQLAYLFQEGIPEYDAGTTYYIGSIIKNLEENKVVLYQSIIDNNIGNPLTDNTKWQKVEFGVNASQASTAAAPSGKFDNLTLGADGTLYTAPANGWFTLRATAVEDYAFFNLLNQTNGILQISDLTQKNDNCGLHIPVKKGDIVGVWYVHFEILSTDEGYFRFVYAEGVKND